jgi:hypothetical protein
LNSREIIFGATFVKLVLDDISWCKVFNLFSFIPVQKDYGIFGFIVMGLAIYVKTYLPGATNYSKRMSDRKVSLIILVMGKNIFEFSVSDPDPQVSGSLSGSGFGSHKTVGIKVFLTIFA